MAIYSHGNISIYHERDDYSFVSIWTLGYLEELWSIMLSSQKSVLIVFQSVCLLNRHLKFLEQTCKTEWQQTDNQDQRRYMKPCFSRCLMKDAPQDKSSKIQLAFSPYDWNSVKDFHQIQFKLYIYTLQTTRYLLILFFGFCVFHVIVNLKRMLVTLHLYFSTSKQSCHCL